MPGGFLTITIALSTLIGTAHGAVIGSAFTYQGDLYDNDQPVTNTCDFEFTLWNTDDVEHVGPMAQDFRAAFELGDSVKATATIDAEGIALVAIPGLRSSIDERDCHIDALEVRNAELEENWAKWRR